MKLAINLPYGEYVFDHDDAIKLMEIFERAEKYETQYRAAEDGGTLHYVSKDASRGMAIKHIPHEVYEMARMAGPKPS
jgi:hypothetical protein